MVVLKNNKGTEENRARHMDYGVQFNKLAYERLLTGGNLTLFSPKDVPGLYDAFFSDQDRFKELYEAAERNPRIRKKTLKAIDLFTMFMQERKNTGRIYLMNVDHANTHSSFIEEVAPIRQSNLCSEITLPTKPLQDLNDPNGLIALCTLSAINWGKIREPKDFEKPCTLAVRGLDALLSYQNYPVLAAEKHTKLYRPLGIGIINFAYWLAKNGLKYSDDSALEMVDEYAEAWSYYLIKASVDLAREKGACDGSHDTKYSQGIMPIDTRKRDVDDLVPYRERMPWNGLREAADAESFREEGEHGGDQACGCAFHHVGAFRQYALRDVADSHEHTVHDFEQTHHILFQHHHCIIDGFERVEDQAPAAAHECLGDPDRRHLDNFSDQEVDHGVEHRHPEVGQILLQMRPKRGRSLGEQEVDPFENFFARRDHFAHPIGHRRAFVLLHLFENFLLGEIEHLQHEIDHVAQRNLERDG
jgi:hypothetical protein